jgi:DNA primase
MPLSQYIVQHLSEDNPLNSQEDKVKFLNDAEPILRQIVAPRFSLMLRKRIAELAEVTDAEMQSLLKLPALNRPPVKATQKQSRAPLSIKKRFVLMLLMQPSLAKIEHLSFAQGFSEENMLLQASIHAALEHSQSKPAALLHVIEPQVDPRLLHEIQRELHLLDESLDFALEFEGARTQLLELTQQKQDGGILDALKEKPFNTLTAEEREMLKNLTVKKI